MTSRDPDDEFSSMQWARSLNDELMDCVDRLGSESDQVDPRVWGHLLVYAPKKAVTLPPLPVLTPTCEDEGYTADQMLDYASAALRAAGVGVK